MALLHLLIDEDGLRETRLWGDSAEEQLKAMRLYELLLDQIAGIHTFLRRKAMLERLELDDTPTRK
ncbi:MAG TPA: hypothetical protein EYP59_06790 [Thiotrichaceae bacterium]|nr:hypothetical protein [Thiotrichaceae bacterium]